MKLAVARSAFPLLMTALLQACGGGGGGNNPGPGPAPRLSVDKTSITVSARPGDETPRGQVDVTVTDPPPEGLFIGARYTTNGIGSLDFTGSTATTGVLQIYFMAPASIPDGVHEDTIELHVCTDEACNNDISGSPVMIRTSYTIRGDRTASIDRTSIEFRTNTQDGNRPVETVQLTIPDQPFGGAFVETEVTSLGIGSGIDSVQLEGVTQNLTNVQITMQNGSSLRPGIYDDIITISVYYDNSRARHLAGSPFTITSHVVNDAGPEPGVAPLQVLSRVSLPHDIVDAEYSAALDAVVMAAAWPDNALYVYDIDDGSERKQALSAAPAAVSVAPDGLTAAVGHDRQITVVDLTQAGLPGAPAPVLLDVSADVLDVVLDGHGKVHALERFAEWQDIHTVDIATNAEQLSTGMQLYGGSLGRLHPSGDFIYTADSRNISSDSLNKWDISASPVAWLAVSPTISTPPVCSSLWFREDGTTIYTACGNTFRATTDPDKDMRPVGKLDLSGDRDFDYRVLSLSQRDATGEIALVEAETDGCERVPLEAARCFTHVAYYESDTLGLIAVYAITPFVLGERAYPQRGLYVFHDAAGSRRVLLSKLDGTADRGAEFYLSLIQ